MSNMPSRVVYVSQSFFEKNTWMTQTCQNPECGKSVKVYVGSVSIITCPHCKTTQEFVIEET